MTAVNLDQFKKVQKVTLDGKEYEVKGVSASQFIGGFLDEETGKLSDREQFEKMIEALGELTTIPVEVLKQQDFGVLTALMLIAQGIDPQTQEAKQ